MQKYLESSEHIDWMSSNVMVQASTLAVDSSSSEEVARKCFEFVRDEIKHSFDYQLNPVTCKASDVLKYCTGYCFAKSHLLAALLRANEIPAALGYQRLAISDGSSYCLHGLNAVYLEGFNWYRIDAQGDNLDVATEFRPPVEFLAFSLGMKGEADLPELWAEPLPIVTKVLDSAKTYLEVAENLPDLELASIK